MQYLSIEQNENLNVVGVATRLAVQESVSLRVIRRVESGMAVPCGVRGFYVELAERGTASTRHSDNAPIHPNCRLGRISI